MHDAPVLLLSPPSRVFADLTTQNLYHHLSSPLTAVSASTATSAADARRRSLSSSSQPIAISTHMDPQAREMAVELEGLTAQMFDRIQRGCSRDSDRDPTGSLSIEGASTDAPDDDDDDVVVCHDEVDVEEDVAVVVVGDEGEDEEEEEDFFDFFTVVDDEEDEGELFNDGEGLPALSLLALSRELFVDDQSLSTRDVVTRSVVGGDDDEDDDDIFGMEI
jgi:hypothetical protein